MSKSKNTEVEERELIDPVEDPEVIKGPIRAANSGYSPKWQSLNDRQLIFSDAIPPKIYSINALIAAGIVNETNLEAYLVDNGYVKNTDYATSSNAGVIKTGSGYGAYTTGAGVIACSARTQQQYNTDGTSMFIAKGTLENAKADITARALVEIAQGQHATPTAGNYTVKLVYDGTAWGVVIKKDN